jgi:hypothetical protein
MACGEDTTPVDKRVSNATDEELQKQGCDLSREATSFVGRAGGSESASKAEGPKPIPCLNLTGYGAAESTLGIAKDGTVIMGPAFTAEGAGVVRTRDHGETWELRIAKDAEGQGHRGHSQPYVYVDPITDQLLFATNPLGYIEAATNTSAPGGFDLTYSADLGDTWSYTTFAVPSRDWGKLFGGPRVSDPEKSVIYFSSPNPLSTEVPFLLPLKHQIVNRSYDGGATWELVSTLPSRPEEVPSCPPDGIILYGSGVVAADGTVYHGVRLCSNLGVAVSQDEGETWDMRVVPDALVRPFTSGSLITALENTNILAGEPLAIDSEGNLYAAWVDADDVIHLSVSRDGAETWSAPVVAMAPEVQSARYVALDAAEPGHLVLAYFGSTDRVTYHGYFAESMNALDGEPVFWSTTANAPDEPLFDDGFDSGFSSIVAVQNEYALEYLHVKFAPDGDVWASFVKDMCPGTENDGECTWDREGHADSPIQGAVGRLTH